MRGAICCHGLAKLKSDSNLCELEGFEVSEKLTTFSSESLDL